MFEVDFEVVQRRGHYMVLEEIVKMNTVESINMEAKVRLDRTDVVGWLKTIAGFSNAQGGIMYDQIHIKEA